jgi:hypothetical protein
MPGLLKSNDLRRQKLSRKDADGKDSKKVGESQPRGVRGADYTISRYCLFQNMLKKLISSTAGNIFKKYPST